MLVYFQQVINIKAYLLKHILFIFVIIAHYKVPNIFVVQYKIYYL